MTNYKKILGASIVLASIAFAMPAQSADPALTENELNLIVADVDIAFSSRWVSGVTSYRLDGSVRTELSIGISDQGKWWLDGNRVCTQWESLRRGRTNCITIFRGEDDTYRTSDGFTIRAL